MKYTKDDLCLLWIDSFEEIDYIVKQYIYKIIKGKSEIRKTLVQSKDGIINYLGEERFNDLIEKANSEYFLDITNKLDQEEIICITIESDDYPEQLKSIDTPPLVLYTKGDISLLKGDIITIVGSRKSLPLSINIAKSIAEELCESNLTLCTGIAEGIDETVLKTAVESGGKVISVIAGGYDNLYPKSNENLLNKVINIGLAISEQPPSVVPKPFFFPRRNRIMAGLSKGSVIISGALKSGTLHTAEYTEEYGRDLFAVPYSVGVRSGEGCNDLIKRGARLITSANDILEFYGLTKIEKQIELSEDELKIVEVLKDGEKHIEKISMEVGQEVYKILPIISMLEIKGIIVKNGENIFALTI